MRTASKTHSAESTRFRDRRVGHVALAGVQLLCHHGKGDVVEAMQRTAIWIVLAF